MRNYCNCTVCGDLVLNKSGFIPYKYKAVCYECIDTLHSKLFAERVDDDLKVLAKLIPRKRRD